MSYRFFTQSTPNHGKMVLEGEQARHAIQVMRFNVGDQIVLFDGMGTEYEALIDQVEKKRLWLSIENQRVVPRGIRANITLAVALPKGDRQKVLVEKLVELGIERLIPLKSNRSVAVANEKVVQRLQKQVVEASKQCGRNRLMKIESECTIDGLPGLLDPSALKLVADPYQGQTILDVSAQCLAEMPVEIVVAIGPEGGLDDGENVMSQELGFQPVRLGPSILRVETAAIAIAAILGIGLESGQTECGEIEE
ncbi:16S rRNA (uracil(1498)-N(3))-methyltransferase [bacterium]|nr:16S rRNA (uracil(1498)-N(3))-methyltransferase [Mariniblastus sp.]MDB4374591.1 16S rRNA (uracil(1498)-N(3))-methyltransferase [bacterium]